jgi:hypothetical protein
MVGAKRSVRFCGLQQQLFRSRAKSSFLTRILAHEDGQMSSG